jgi:O-antigen/teichoic acid export membrane protein
VADQGVASSTNFVLNILLARWLLARDYGAYSVCWSILLVLAAFHNALILEPMTIVGPAEFGGKLNAYFRANNRLNWLVSAALAFAGLLFALLYKEAVVRACLLVLALCVPGYLLLLTARRKQYVINQPVRALQISAVYAILVFTVVSVCRASGKLSAVSGVAAFGTAWFSLAFVRAQPDARTVSMKEVAREHWRYGKWIAASAVLAIGASDLQTLLLSMLVDLKAAGALRALMNFVLPLSQLLTVLSIYALPRLSTRAKNWGTGPLLRKGILFPLALTAVSAVYLGVLVLAAPQAEHLLYAGKMEQYMRWVPLLAASAFLSAVGAPFSTLLRAVQNSQHVFIAGVTGTAVGAAFAFLLQRNLGIAGALWSLLAANTASTLVIVAFYVWFLRRGHA